MDNLFEIYYRLLEGVNHDFVRYLMPELQKDRRLVGIIGARGTGKTTLMLQCASALPQKGKTLYVSLEELYFKRNNLVDLVDTFVKKGGQYLFLDEVHRYSGWANEIKIIYDRYASLQIVFTGSSLIELRKGKADLSRRALMFNLQGLSFREYINLTTGLNLGKVSLDQLMDDHENLARKISKKIKPLEYFEEYSRSGYYPFFRENLPDYDQKLRQVIDLALTIDLAAAYDIPYSSIEKIGQLLSVIAISVPFKPDVTAISGQISIDRNTLIRYLGYLEDIDIIHRLYSSADGMGGMRKPAKIYLNNTNLMWAIGKNYPEKGNLRETFFLNQLRAVQDVFYPKAGDFLVGKYTFEIGGKTKKRKQVDGVLNAHVVKDDIEIGFDKTLPLWLFGFLY
jgi:predicted AAA+ superfamily ATPase